MDELSISSSVLPGSTRLLGFRGSEAISRPYEIDVYFTIRGDEAGSFDPGDAIGAKALLTLDRRTAGVPPFWFSGIFATVELLHEVDDYVLVRARVVPRLWLLTLSRHSRVFTKVDFPSVLRTLLEEAGLGGDDFEMRLGAHETEEHICQYRESDFDFISRWMEREGIFYFFEHSEEGEKVVFCDDKAYDEDGIGTAARYSPDFGGDSSAGASLRTFTSRHATLPAMVKLRDYDYARPNLNVSGAARVSKNGVGEVSLYGERFFTPGAGDRLAHIRAEELLARQVVFQTTGSRFHLRSGYTFTLEDHPRGAWNTKYLTIEAVHHGNAGMQSTVFAQFLDFPHKQTYVVEATVIPAKTAFRAERRTPWPRIYGFENGVVDGPADSEYAQIDDQGRYNVKLKFDEGSLKSGKASTFVRMMQPHGGGIEGFHFPLRKATEVVVSFLGGDPDRPVISGVVPNALTPSPVTSGNHTKNVIQTGGRNRLELEDKAGQQRITLSTPYSNTYLRMGSPNEDHELIAKTDDNGLLEVGKRFDLDVGHNGGGSWSAKIKDNWVTHVESGLYWLEVDSGTSTTVVKGNTLLRVREGDLSTEVLLGAMTTSVEKDSTTTVKTGNYTVNVNTGNTLIDTLTGTATLHSKSKMTLKTDDQMEIDVKSNMVQNVDGDYKGEIKGAQQLATHGPFNWIYKSNNVNVTYGVKSDTFLGLSNTNQVGASISTFLGGKVTLECSEVLNAAFSFKHDFVGGMSFTMKAGLAMTINNAVEVLVKPTQVESVGAKVSRFPGYIAMQGLHYSLSNAHVIT